MFIYKKFKNFIDSGQTRKKFFSGFFCGLVIIFLLGNFFMALPAVALAEAGDGPQRVEELSAELNAQIEELSKQIEEYQKIVVEIQGQAKSFQREVSLLDNQIRKFELEIKQAQLFINDLEAQIKKAELNIKDLEQQTSNERVILGELIREIYKYDETSILEIVLTKENLSDFFSELQSLENFQIGIQRSLEAIKVLKKQVEDKKINLEDKKSEMIGLKTVQEAQKQAIEKTKKERQKLLEDTRGQEYLYQRLVKTRQADINTIRSQLYVLQGMGGSLSFENALNIAEFASSVTGVRPAFLLAVLSRESGWGANVGTGTWRTDMKPSQYSAYLAICEKLGFNPDMMPVSKRAWYGWGGAMGPAQFLPATWLGYESRIAAITGHNPPNPWNIEDAFVASALYLANAGATARTYQAEHKAYMIYLAGSNWWKRYLWFYGDQVMNLAATIQEQVNLIKGI